MPYRVLSQQEVADYLHLTAADIERLVKNHDIPCELRGKRPVFRKRDIDEWASQRILKLADKPLAEYHQKSTRATQTAFPTDAIMPDLIQPAFIAPRMTAKTKASVIRDMVALAASTGRVYDPRVLLASVEEREELCPTAFPGGLALLHSRYQQPAFSEEPFIVLGRALQPIHFGSPDGRPTDLFFLVCCQDVKIHLHTLARICLMAQKSPLLAQLREAEDANAMYDCLVNAEAEVLEKQNAAE
ncbi:MAG: PTS sugar transporter subunit IIA [Verrucomicrobia bacterium]|nr:PTS sugar transporter subunit IIA [Verrucomicrobiota bacterium]